MLLFFVFDRCTGAMHRSFPEDPECPDAGSFFLDRDVFDVVGFEEFSAVSFEHSPHISRLDHIAESFVFNPVGTAVLTAPERNVIEEKHSGVHSLKFCDLALAGSCGFLCFTQLFLVDHRMFDRRSHASGQKRECQKQ